MSEFVDRGHHRFQHGHFGDISTRTGCRTLAVFGGVEIEISRTSTTDLKESGHSLFSAAADGK